MASIRKRGDSYQITVSIGRDSSGKKLVETTTFHPTGRTERQIQKELNKFVLEFEEKCQNGGFLKGDKLTFNDVLEEWRSGWAQDHLTLGTLEGYEAYFQRYAQNTIGNMKMNKITPMILQSMVNDMKKSLAPKSIRRIFTAFNSVFRYAYRLGIIEHNPIDRIEFPKNQKDDSLHYWELSQAKSFLESLEKGYAISYPSITRKNGRIIPEHDERIEVPLQFAVFYNLAVFGGCRKGELVALTWEDIDFNEKTLNICKAAAETRSQGQIIKSTKTVSGLRKIVIPSNCISILQRWHNEEMKHSMIMGSAWKGYRGKDFDKNFIFIQDDGQMMDLHTPTKKFRHLIDFYNREIDCREDLDDDEKEFLKLPRIRLHDLRHTSATLLLGFGVDVTTVSKRLGHSSPSITLDVYSHALQQMDQKAAGLLETLFKEA